MKSETVGFIFARGGSKGVPRKNIRLLAGKPLIAYSIESALNSTLIDRVCVSTDDEEIAEVARQYGAEVPFIRPRDLASDTASEWLAWRHAIQTWESLHCDKKIGVFVSVPPTSPLRDPDDLDSCVRALVESDADIVITVKEAHNNPYFNMVIINPSGYAGLVVNSNKILAHRQSAPPVFDMTTVAYVSRPSFVLSANSTFDGKVKAVLIPVERAVDIDTELDFEFTKFLLSYKLERKG